MRHTPLCCAQHIVRHSRCLENISRLDSQRAREAVNVVEARIAFAALDSADIGAIHAGELTQLLLAQAPILADGAHPLAEGKALLLLRARRVDHQSTLAA